MKAINQNRRRFIGNPAFPKRRDAFLTGVECLINNADRLLIQHQGTFAHAREQCFELRRQPLHYIQINRAGRAFQAVRATESLVEFWPSLRIRNVLE